MKPSQRIRERTARTTDGFQNLLLRIGEGSTVMAGARYGTTGLSWDPKRLEALYRESWIVGKVVDAIAEDMTRAGVDFTGIDPEDAAKLQRQMTRKGFWRDITATIKWARLYGGAVAVINVSGQALDTELRMETVKKEQLNRLRVFDRWSINPDPDARVLEGRDLGDPEFYTVPRLGLKVHHTRVLRFLGEELPWNQSQTENGWGQSVIQRLFDRLVPFDSATAGASQLMTKAHLRTVAVDKLREILAQGGVAEENLIKMFSLMSKLQNNEGVTLIDKEDTFSATSYTFAGVGDLLTQIAQQISGASGIPLVRLLGQSPAGLSATGESDMRNYHDSISQKQENDLRAPLLKLAELLHWAVLGEAPEDDFDFEFNPLMQPDAKTKADTATVMTDAVVKAFEAELIDSATAMRELLHVGAVTGVFNNITDDAIDTAEERDKLANEDPPAPPPGLAPLDPNNPVPPELNNGLPPTPPTQLSQEVPPVSPG